MKYPELNLIQPARLTRPLGKVLARIGSRLRSRGLPVPPLRGPCLVLGSAPGASLPEGFGRHWSVISVNASQVIGERFGIQCPAMTVMSARLLGEKPAAREAQSLLRGGRTGALILIEATSIQQPYAKLAAMEYGHDSCVLLSRDQRLRITTKVLGPDVGQASGPNKISTGVLAVVLALHAGAHPVVMSGFSFSLVGHDYGNLPVHDSSRGGPRRSHLDHDRQALDIIRARRLAVYAGDTIFAQESGLCAWPG